MAMAIFLTATLVASILGMTAILWLKRYELTTGHVFLSGVRPQLRAFFRQGFFLAQRVLPRLARHEGERLFGLGRAAAKSALARGIIAIERWLEQGLRTLRQMTTHTPHAKGEASPFLREVAEHKKKLQEEREDDAQ